MPEPRPVAPAFLRFDLCGQPFALRQSCLVSLEYIEDVVMSEAEDAVRGEIRLGSRMIPVFELAAWLLPEVLDDEAGRRMALVIRAGETVFAFLVDAAQAIATQGLRLHELPACMQGAGPYEGVLEHRPAAGEIELAPALDADRLAGLLPLSAAVPASRPGSLQS